MCRSLVWRHLFSRSSHSGAVCRMASQGAGKGCSPIRVCFRCLRPSPAVQHRRGHFLSSFTPRPALQPPEPPCLSPPHLLPFSLPVPHSLPPIVPFLPLTTLCLLFFPSFPFFLFSSSFLL